MRFVYRIIESLCNLIGVSAADAPGNLQNDTI